MTDPLNRDPLLRDGWTRRFTASEPRLSEAVAAYEEAGFEVRLEPLPPATECGTCPGEEDGGGDCRICFHDVEDRYRVIYTRPKNTTFPPSTPDENLLD